jgi:hypothetical protein
MTRKKIIKIEPAQSDEAKDMKTGRQVGRHVGGGTSADSIVQQWTEHQRKWAEKIRYPGRPLSGSPRPHVIDPILIPPQGSKLGEPMSVIQRERKSGAPQREAGSNERTK